MSSISHSMPVRSCSEDNDAVDVQMEDPFDSVVNTRFLDVFCQDEQGNSALMLAIENERISQTKTILHMAVNMGRLATVLAIKNSEGKTALDLAKEKGNVEAVKIMRRASKSAGRSRERLRSVPMSRASIDDLEIDFAEPKPEKTEVQTNAFEYRRPFFMHRHLNRERLTNSLSEREFSLLKRSRSANKTLYSRAFSTSSEKETSSPPCPAIPTVEGNGKDISERLKALFGKKAEPERSLDKTPPLPPSNTPKFNEFKENKETNFVEVHDDEDFRNSGFTSLSASSSGFKLPPLFNLRRRANSEGRKYLKD